jgi:EAL domain-containing protein (putative c-di-GMP-specific phosphodiesterase class I)/GGDEF domain-containing protein
MTFKMRLGPSGPNGDSISEVERIIRNGRVDVHFQPIMDLRTGTVFGYEALTRPPADCKLSNVGELFSIADKAGLLRDLEIVTRRSIIKIIAEHDGPENFFMNVSPAVFGDEQFPVMLGEECQIVPAKIQRRIVLELTELSEHHSISQLAQQSERLRRDGYSIAIDDVGSGTSGLNRIMRMRPQWLKLDLELIRHVDQDPFKKNLLKFLVHFARLSHIGLVAEGIEDEDELQTLVELGISHGQGYLLGRPAPYGTPVDTVWQERLPEIRRQAESRNFSDPRDARLGDLGSLLPTCMADSPVAQIRELVKRLEQPRGIAMLSGRRLVGYVSASNLLDPNLDADPDTPIQELDENGWLVASPEMTVADGLRLILSRSDAEIAAPLLVVSDDVVRLLPVRELLVSVSQVGSNANAHTASLTGLPDRVQVDSQLQHRIETVDQADVAFVDLRHFGEYNQAFGVRMGDEMLLHLAAQLVSCFPGRAGVESDELGCFVGHVVDDQFVVISARRDFRAQLQKLIREIESAQHEFFTPEDIERGGFEVPGSDARPIVIPLSNVRVLLIERAFHRVADPREVYRIAGMLRVQDRMNEQTSMHNSIVIDRRVRSGHPAQWDQTTFEDDRGNGQSHRRLSA